MKGYVTTSFNIPLRLKEKLDIICEEDSKTVTSIIIDALNIYLRVRERLMESFEQKIDDFNSNKITLDELSTQLGISPEQLLSIIQKGQRIGKTGKLKSIFDRIK